MSIMAPMDMPEPLAELEEDEAELDDDDLLQPTSRRSATITITHINFVFMLPPPEDIPENCARIIHRVPAKHFPQLSFRGAAEESAVLMFRGSRKGAAR